MQEISFILDLISGVSSFKIFSRLLQLNEEYPENLNMIFDVISMLYHDGNNDTAMMLIEILTNQTGIELPFELSKLCRFPELAEQFILSFLLDFENFLEEIDGVC